VGNSGNLSAENVEAYFAESAAVLTKTAGACGHSILEVASMLVDAIRAGSKIMVCGNGGSAADAQHFAAELVGRFDKNVERAALPALALTTDTSFLTAYSNDYGFSGVFARQVEALGKPGDVLVMISSSGNSANLLAATQIAKRENIITIAFLGGGGGELAPIVDRALIVPGDNPQHVQECHAAIVHSICFAIERALFTQPTAEHLPSEYETRLTREVNFYQDCENVHDLPQIFHYWSEQYLRPKLHAVGIDSIESFFLEAIAERCVKNTSHNVTIASIGAGNCDLECSLASELKKRSVENFRIECVDINSQMLERGRNSAEGVGVARNMAFVEADVNRWNPVTSYDGYLASHSLHHVLELENLFAAVRRTLLPDGMFLVHDMIGRNGHMRWPEALKYVEEIWTDMPERYKYNHQLKRIELEYENWDCSKEGFEGVRSQDILPLLLEQFSTEVFVAFGNIIDVFIDRSFGPNLSVERDEDRAFVDFVAKLDDQLIDEGTIKPTHMLARFSVEPTGNLNCYRHWTPEYSLRRRTLSVGELFAGSSDGLPRQEASIS
jgi:phosphoheptose isomerase